MSCACDQFQFPPALNIPASLSQLPRQIGTFADFRRAMLHAIAVAPDANKDPSLGWAERYMTEPDHAALAQDLAAFRAWRGRHPQEYGMMLIEMWAYVCDITSFYDEVLAGESYLGTAGRRPSLRKLVDLLGYLPQPALGALADLAVFAEGRQPVTVPVGTAFRSGSFDGNAPQVFETTGDQTIDPFSNKWTLLPKRPTTLASGILLCEIGSVSVKKGDFALLKINGVGYALTVQGISKHIGSDGLNYSAVSFEPNTLNVPSLIGKAVGAVELMRATATSSLWRNPLVDLPPSNDLINLDLPASTFGVYDDLILQNSADCIAVSIASIVRALEPVQLPATHITGDSSSTITPPPINLYYTQLKLSAPLFGTGLRWSVSDSPKIKILYGFTSAGKVTTELPTLTNAGETLDLQAPFEQPRDPQSDQRFQFEDKNGVGRTQSLLPDFGNRTIVVKSDSWPTLVVPPLSLFGNILSVYRGETVKSELLGTGDAATPNQSFTLKKKPLTYLPVNTPEVFATTLTVSVDGLAWTEVPYFYNQPSDAQVFIVRQNDKGESLITFGDGVFGQRLNTGAQVTASYCYGAGAAMPPAGSITQIAKAVKGLKSVRSPVAPREGADAEDGKSLATRAPRSALLFGRAISLTDMETAVALNRSVRVVTSEWKWNADQQGPAAHLWYISDSDITSDLQILLDSMVQPGTPFSLDSATKLSAKISIDITTDPRRDGTVVAANVQAALLDLTHGILPPERLGIGKPLFRSNIFETVLNVTGVTGITKIQINLPGGDSVSDTMLVEITKVYPRYVSDPQTLMALQFPRDPSSATAPCDCNDCSCSDYALKPVAGCYFDFLKDNVKINSVK